MRLKKHIEEKPNKMHLKVSHNTFKQKALSFISIIMVIISCMGIFTIHVSAANIDNYYSHVSKDELKDLFGLNISDIPHPWEWIAEATTFVIVEDNGDGKYTYWWNTPNLQMSFQNSLYGIISQSGYGSGSGKTAKENQWLVEVPANRDDAKTALEKYGFQIQNPTYIGERPLITISIVDVLLPDNFFDGVGRLWNCIWSGNVVELPTGEDLKTLLYVAPRDYEFSSASLKYWIKKNWYIAMQIIDQGQILLSNTDKNGADSDGVIWVRGNIIDAYGLQNETDPDKIISQLQRICGKNFADVMANIIVCSGIKEDHSTDRIMPYDLDRLNDQDKLIFHGIVDHRTTMQESLFSTGYDNLLWGMFKSTILSWSSSLAEVTVALNGVANFSFIENLGFDPTIMWDNVIVDLLVGIMLAAFLFFAIKSVIMVIRGRKGAFQVATKVAGIFIICMLVVGLALNPAGVYTNIKDISTTIFNLGNVGLEANPTVDALYGTGNAQQKENCELWLPYYGAWTKYHTNTGLLEEGQKIDTSNTTNKPEYNSLKVPQIDGVDQVAWSTVLADTVTQNKNYSNTIYRMVDHFMAPRITSTTLSKDGEPITLTVEQNENFKDNIQSSPSFESIPFQILILLLVCIKVLLFFEFILNIAMLLVNISLAVTSKFRLGLVLKELGASALNVMFVNIILVLVVWTCLITSGFIAIFICAFYFFALFAIVKMLAQSNSIFTPKFLRSARKVFYETKELCSD